MTWRNVKFIENSYYPIIPHNITCDNCGRSAEDHCARDDRSLIFNFCLEDRVVALKRHFGREKVPFVKKELGKAIKYLQRKIKHNPKI